MSRFSDPRYIKQLAKTVISENGLKVRALNGRLWPPVNTKTLSRVLNTKQAPSPQQHQAIIGLLANQLSLSTQLLENFERKPFARQHRHLLSRAVGESYPITEHSLKRLATRTALIEAKTDRIRVFDANLPDELWPPENDDNVEAPRDIACSVTILRSALKPYAPENRPFGFGNQDDRDEAIENMIGAVETGRVDLRIVDDLPPANFSKIMGLVAPYTYIKLYDNRAALLRLRNSRAFCLITKEGSPAAATVIRSLAIAIDRLANHLCHAPTAASVIHLLDGFLSPSSWRSRLMLWKQHRNNDAGLLRHRYRVN